MPLGLISIGKKKFGILLVSKCGKRWLKSFVVKIVNFNDFKFPVFSGSDVWQGTSGTSRDVPAVGLECLTGLKMCCEKNVEEREKKRERMRENERE